MNMRLDRLLGSLLVLSALNVQAAPVPVVEINETAPVAAPAGAGRPLSVQNEMVLMLQQLQDEVRTLRGIVEQQQYRLDQLERQQRERYRDVDRRLGLLIQQLPSTEPAAATSPVAADSALPATPAAAAQAPAAAVTAPADSAAAPDQVAYEAAFARVRARDFAAARDRLKAFIGQYPDSPLLANAWYWLGEVELAQQHHDDAHAAFSRVIEQYAASSKAADALYKLGVLAGRAGDLTAARTLMQRVVDQYPQAPAADLARAYLKP